MSDTSNPANLQPNSVSQVPNSQSSDPKSEKINSTPDPTALNPLKTIPNSDQSLPNSNPIPKPSPKIAFHSGAVSKPTAQHQNFFAEQNQKAHAKKQANSKKIKLALIIIGIILGLALIGGLIWFVISQLGSTPAPEDKPYEEMSEAEQTEHNSNIAQNIYNSVRDQEQQNPENPADSEAQLNAANEQFQAAADSAANNTEANVIRLSQMRYLLESGEYAAILEIGPSVCEDTSLDLGTRSSCANIMALAAHKRGNEELYNYYKNLQLKLTEEEMQLDDSGGGI